MSGASGAVDLGTEEGRAFLQERLAFLGAIGFVFQSGFFVLGQIALALIVPGLVAAPWSASRTLALISDLSGQLLWLGVWVVARRGRRPPGFLRALDVLATLSYVLCALPTLAMTRGGMASGAPFAGSARGHDGPHGARRHRAEQPAADAADRLRQRAADSRASPGIFRCRFRSWRGT